MDRNVKQSCWKWLHNLFDTEHSAMNQQDILEAVDVKSEASVRLYVNKRRTRCVGTCTPSLI